MPKYEYQCKSCNEKFDIQHSMREDITEIKCPKCGSMDVERVYSSPFAKILGNLKTFRIPT